MPRTTYRFLFYLFVLALTLPAPPLRAAPAAQILILNSYHPQLPWSRGLMAGFDAVFDQAALDLNIHVEYVDGLHHRHEAIFPVLEAFLRAKYRDIPLDLIITTDDPALDFVFFYRHTLFPGIPVVFCGPNNFAPARLEGHTNITGIAENPGIGQTVQLIRKLHPTRHRIAVVADRSPASLRVIANLQDFQQQPASIVEFMRLTDTSLHNLTAELQLLAPGTPVIFHAFLRDADGTVHSNNLEVLQTLSSHAPLPFYTFKKIDLEHGVVGGAVICKQLMAQTAVHMALEINGGTPAHAIPVIYDTPQLFMFDQRKLQEFAIPTYDLPGDALIVYKPESF